MYENNIQFLQNNIATRIHTGHWIYVKREMKREIEHMRMKIQKGMKRDPEEKRERNEFIAEDTHKEMGSLERKKKKKETDLGEGPTTDVRRMEVEEKENGGCCA